MIGTMAALATMAGIKAGSDAIGAVAASKASKKAADYQIKATNEAKQALAQLWGQQQDFQQPYRNVGDNAANLMGSLMRPAGSQGSYRPGGLSVTPPDSGGFPPMPMAPPPMPPAMPMSMGHLMTPRGGR